MMSIRPLGSAARSAALLCVVALGSSLTSGCRIYDYSQVEMSEGYETVADVLQDWSYMDRLYVSCKDTWWDLWDVFSLNASFGEGFIANVHLTRYANLGLGWFDGMRYGTMTRAQGAWEERGWEWGLLMFYWKNKTIEPVYGNRVLFEKGMSYDSFELEQNNRDGHALDVGLRAHMILMGASVDLSPKETVDFTFSLLGIPYTLIVWPFNAIYGLEPPEIDISNDNEISRIRTELHAMSGAIYQPSTPFLERTGPALPPQRRPGQASQLELEAGMDPLRLH